MFYQDSDDKSPPQYKTAKTADWIQKTSFINTETPIFGYKRRIIRRCALKFVHSKCLKHLKNKIFLDPTLY